MKLVLDLFNYMSGIGVVRVKCLLKAIVNILLDVFWKETHLATVHH